MHVVIKIPYFNLLVYEKYDEVLEAVRQGKVFAAIINSDIAAYRQREKEFENLAVTTLINIEIPIKMMVNKRRFKEIHCTSKNHKTSVDNTLAKYRKKLNVSPQQNLVDNESRMRVETSWFYKKKFFLNGAFYNKLLPQTNIFN